MITPLQEARRLYFHLERKDKKDETDRLIEDLLFSAKRNDPMGEWWTEETAALDPLTVLFETKEPQALFQDIQMELLTKMKWLMQGKEFDLLKNMPDLLFQAAFASSEEDDPDFLEFAREKGRADFWYKGKGVTKRDYVDAYRTHLAMKVYNHTPPNGKRERACEIFEEKIKEVDVSKKDGRAKMRKLEEEYVN